MRKIGQALRKIENVKRCEKIIVRMRKNEKDAIRMRQMVKE
jgi:hypothetical protein